ncbi:hypothetical protein KM043_007680 [Ampulex compressa]|nr:hypothetical protein KM043_007680 [Ampulex compressa]
MTLTDDQSKNRGWGPRNYLCTDCSKTFSLKASLTRHRIFECNKQALTSEKIVSGTVGDRKKPKKKYACPKCNRAYAFFTSLWRHQHYECGVEPKFTCPICRVRFSQKSNLDRHVRTRH